MVDAPRDQDDGKGILGLSHRLVALHVAGVALLILVVLSSVVWVSAEHNKLAKVSSENLVQAGVQSLRSRALTLVRDYSIWDEGYEGVLADDRAWLYRNIGVGVTEIGTFDLVLLDVPGDGPPFGWLSDSPEDGQIGVLPDDVLDPVLALLKDPGPGSVATRTLIAEFQGEPWIFAVSRVTPVAGLPEGAAIEDLPWQIHGQRLSQERVAQIGQNILADDLTLAAAPAPGQASVPLIDFTGKIIRYLVWAPPRPGASILNSIAFPLGMALLLVTIISAVSSRYAVRSARRLERALFDAKAADRSKTEFLSNVSHELRTPMNGILGVAQLLRTTELDGEQGELVDVLFASATTQMSLISDLLDLSRMECGNRPLTEAPFDPAAVLKELADMMRVAATKRRIAFEADWSALAGMRLRGDSRAFQQIVTNLLGNAVKFTDHGRVEMRAQMSQANGRARVVVVVQDTGPGIPEAALSRIFDRFYQVDGSTTRAKEGTGLGLAISQELARMTGGRIDVSSQLGTGSTFAYSVELEIVKSAQGERDAA